MTESKQLTPIQEIRHTLGKMEPEFAKALVKTGIPSEKFVRVTMTAIQKNPDLLSADRHSLYSACSDCAAAGLLPDRRQAALVIFGKTVVYMPMIAGILKLIRNSGELSSIVAQVLYERDVSDGRFRYEITSERGEWLEYRPDLFAADRGPVIGAFAMAKLTDDAVYVTVMSKAEIEKVRAVSRGKDSGPWVSWWDQMAEKTVLRRLSKRLPMSTDIDMNALFGDDDPDERVVGVSPQAPAHQEMVNVTPAPDAQPEPKQTRQSRARDAVEAKKQKPVQTHGYVVEEISVSEDWPQESVSGDIIDGETGEVYGPDEIPI